MYSPNLQYVRPAGFQFSFQKSQVKPKPAKPVTLGPGYYEPAPPRRNARSKESWFFHSNARRIAYLEEENDQPGPGEYDGVVSMAREKQRTDAFGSATERNIPLGHDPHRPYVTSQDLYPPVGYYYNREQVKKTEKLREKYVAPKIVPVKPAFGTAVSRFPGLSNQRPLQSKDSLGSLLS